MKIKYPFNIISHRKFVLVSYVLYFKFFFFGFIKICVYFANMYRLQMYVCIFVHSMEVHIMY